MPMDINCECGNALYLNDHLAGKQVVCPSCGAIIKVPGPSDREAGREGAKGTEEPMPVRPHGAIESVPGPALPPRQTILRSLALFFGILGGLSSGAVGVLFLSGTLDPREQESVQRAEAVLTRGRRDPYDMTPEEAQKVVAECRLWLGRGYLLLAGGILGPIGGCLAYSRRRWLATSLLVIAALAPVVLLPMVILATLPLLIAAALAVPIRPRWRPSRTVAPRRSAAWRIRKGSVIESQFGQRLIGLLVLILGGGFTAWSWYTALTEGYYYRKAVALFPVFAVVGLGLLLFPIDVKRLQAEHGVRRPQSLAHYPLAWKVLFFVALAAGLGNWLAISQF